jgi:hypothetical protein
LAGGVGENKLALGTQQLLGDQGHLFNRLALMIEGQHVSRGQR